MRVKVLDPLVDPACCDLELENKACSTSPKRSLVAVVMHSTRMCKSCREAWLSWWSKEVFDCLVSLLVRTEQLTVMLTPLARLTVSPSATCVSGRHGTSSLRSLNMFTPIWSALMRSPPCNLVMKSESAAGTQGCATGRKLTCWHCQNCCIESWLSSKQTQPTLSRSSSSDTRVTWPPFFGTAANYITHAQQQLSCSPHTQTLQSARTWPTCSLLPPAA